MNNLSIEKAKLYDTIDCLTDKDPGGGGVLSPQESKQLRDAQARLKEIEAQEAKEKQGVEREVSRKVKQAQHRGRNAEYACAKETKGVRVGRSKAVLVGDRYVQVNCQKPPDVLSPPFFSWECKNTKIPKAISKAMKQAIDNAPESFIPQVWWYDKGSQVTYIVSLKRDFLGLHI